MTIAFVLFVLACGFRSLEKRDEANAKYWGQKQSQCRSLGNDWDLNNQGKCVQFIPQI